jgi:hypothetical protein
MAHPSELILEKNLRDGKEFINEQNGEIKHKYIVTVGS